MNFILLVLVVSVVVFLFSKSTRMAAVLTVISTALSVSLMMWMFSKMGMVRLLGLAHLIFWIPLVVYLYGRLRTGNLQRLQHVVMWILVATLVTAMVFDAYDVLRWLLGNRASVVSVS